MIDDNSTTRIWPVLLGLGLLQLLFVAPFVFVPGTWDVSLPHIPGLSEPRIVDHLHPTDLDGDPDDELLVFRELEDGMRLQALEFRTDEHLWSRDVEGLSTSFSGAIRRSGDTLVIPQEPRAEHGLVAFDLDDRRVRWRRLPSIDNQVELFAHEGVAVAAVNLHDIHAFDVETGDRLWHLPTSELTCTERLEATAGYLFASCEKSSSAGLYRISMATGEYRGFPSHSKHLAAFRPDGTAFLMRNISDDSEGTRLELYRVPPDADEARPVTRDGDPVTIPFYPGGEAAYRDALVVTKRDGIRRHIALSAFPFADGGPEFRWEVPNGDAMYAPLGGFRQPQKLSGSPPVRDDTDLLPVFVGRQIEGDDSTDYSQKLVLFDLAAGRPRWQSRRFHIRSRLSGDEDVLRHGDRFIVHLDGLRDFPPDASSDAETSGGPVVLTLDAETGEILGAVQLDLVLWPPAHPDTALADDILFGVGKRRPWAVDLLTGEVLYGSTVAARDVRSELDSLLGPLPTTDR